MYTIQELKTLRDKKEGVYLIRHKDGINYPNLIYVGQSIDIYRRWREHLLLGKRSGAKKLTRAFKKYGVDNFIFEIIEERTLKGTIFEQKWIVFYDSIKNGLNITLNVNDIPRELKSLGGRKTVLKNKTGEASTFWNSERAKKAQQKSLGAAVVWRFTYLNGKNYYCLGTSLLAKKFLLNQKSFANWASSEGTIKYKEFKDMKIVRLKSQTLRFGLQKGLIYTEEQIQSLKMGELLET